MGGRGSSGGFKYGAGQVLVGDNIGGSLRRASNTTLNGDFRVGQELSIGSPDDYSTFTDKSGRMVDGQNVKVVSASNKDRYGNPTNEMVIEYKNASGQTERATVDVEWFKRRYGRYNR